jgi:alpha-tubulin suppressor-like RCC1 family protein
MRDGGPSRDAAIRGITAPPKERNAETMPPPERPIVSAGAFHACSIATDGSLTCWGIDGGQPLDVGQVRDTPSGRFVDIGASDVHSCGIRTNGEVACWGIEEQIDGTKIQYDQGQVTDAPDGDGFRSVDVGDGHSCALTQRGGFECWGVSGGGKYDFGQVSEAPSGRFRQLECGSMYCCAIARDRSISCWGLDEDDDTSQEHGQVTDAPETGRYIDLATGAAHACAIAEDERSIECWGLDDGGNFDYGQVSDHPTEGRYQSISAGDKHSCAISVQGDITCWGPRTQPSDYGQVTEIPDGTYTTLTAGHHFNCAVERSGDITCWGRDHYGQVSGAP